MQDYVPLWCKSNYSFLEGASHPDELIEQAHALGLSAIAVTDRDGVYGIVRAHVRARELGIKLLVGSEITLREGATLLLFAQTKTGYSNLCRIISAGRLANPKGSSEVSLAEIEEHADGLIALLPPRPSPDTADTDRHQVPETSNMSHERPGTGSDDAPAPEAAGSALPLARSLKATFGDRLYFGVARHYRPEDIEQEHRQRRLAECVGAPCAAAPEFLYHTPERRRLQDVLTCIRHRVSLPEAGTLLRQNAQHALLSREDFASLHRDDERLIRRTREIAARCSFSLDELSYRYPTQRLPKGYTMSDWLRELTFDGAHRRYGRRIPQAVEAQLHKELELIDELGYCGYFLTMWEIVDFCKRRGILCQGRGSAANSAVCYCLGITAIDPVRMDLLFERFVSRERAEPPDIDLDIEHGRREEVIQHVYHSYGRAHAAMVANVVRYRMRSAIRDVGKALGIPQTVLDRLAKLASHRESTLAELLETENEVPAREHLIQLVPEILDFPRHLSIHPGGFLLGNEPVPELVPVENATMPDRTVIQWDKYDVEEMNLFKVDLLGLGALTHLHHAFSLLQEYYGVSLSMAGIPAHDPDVFCMISRSDTIGVFQLESRAQMAMLPRLKPEEFYDIVIEVSIVRPGPITGGMVHPYLKRRSGEQPVRYPHPNLEPVLKKTLGVPLFQEQVMKVAIVAADYSPGEADQLRRDMAAWRRTGRIEKHKDKLIARMARKGIAREFAEQVFEQIRGFGEYGFPESHAASFALIAYCTAWMRCRYPAVFVCALLNAWPMGFYAPATIVADAHRHGITMLPVDARASQWECTLEPLGASAGREPGRARYAIRMGLRYVKGFGQHHWRGIAKLDRRDMKDIHEFVRESGLDTGALSALARAGAFSCFGIERRQALWAVLGKHDEPDEQHTHEQPPSHRRDADRTGASGENTNNDMESAVASVIAPGSLEIETDEEPPDFPELDEYQSVLWDYRHALHSTHGHPLESRRQELTAQGYPDAAGVSAMEDGQYLCYIGLVICRQRPDTAGGTVFFTLEDETGFVNLIIRKETFAEYRSILLTTSLLGICGTLQARGGTAHVIVHSCFRARRSIRGYHHPSRDFH